MYTKIKIKKITKSEWKMSTLVGTMAAELEPFQYSYQLNKNLLYQNFSEKMYKDTSDTNIIILKKK